MSFLAELKRRKVIRVAVVYAATAFVVLQAADIMLPRLAVPDWAMTLVVVFAVLGFPIAVVLGWALEVTPDGVKVTRPRDAAPTDDPPPALLGKRTVFAVALLVVLGVGIGAGWFLRPVSGPDVTPPVEPAAELAADAPAVVDRSIAVLPFVNMSADPEQEYFSDGLSEEILNLLAQIRDLRVIGRTSSFAFKGRNEDLRNIGSTLGVAYLLEGSVRKAGNDLRITALLIQTDDGSHLWSQSYDRRLENVFAIQSEIAGAIAEALKISLVGPNQAAPVAQAAASLPAYDLFLQARRLMHGRTRSGIEAARELLDEALTLDPDYAPAQAAAAQAVLHLCAGLCGYGDIPLDQAVAMAQPLLDRALALDPNLSEAHAVQGLLFRSQRDFVRAEGALARALALNPSQADALLWQASSLGDAGRLREQLATQRRLAELDPLHVANLAALPWTLLNSGEPAEAEAVAGRLQRAFPDNPQGFTALASVLANTGRVAEARLPAAQALALAPADASAKIVNGWIFYTLGDFERALLSWPGVGFQHDLALIALGRIEEAVATGRERSAAAPGDHEAALTLLFTLSLAGRHDEVQALYLERWGDLEGLDAHFGIGRPGLLAPIAAAQHALGQHQALAETLAHWRERLVFMREQGHGGPWFRFSEAGYLALTGEHTAALTALTEAIDLGARDPLLGQDPAFADLHDDPAFQSHVSRMIDLINIERAKLDMAPLP